MNRPLLALLAAAVALLPSANLAWQSRAMPQLGVTHDDAVYYVTAKSLAEGNGYRIASLPNQLHQTKYPPLWPWMLSWVWRLSPEFPGNLPWAALLTWIMLPLAAGFSWLLWRQAGFREREAALLTVLALVNPVAVLFSVLLMSELVFCVFLFASLLLAERALKDEEPGWLAAAAGVLAGVAFLARTASLPLLVSAPLCFLLRRHWRRGALFLLSMLPFVAAWQLWVRAHLTPGRDIVTMWYTNYFGFYLENVSLEGMPRLAWLNTNLLVKAIGEILIFDESVTLGSVTLARVTTAATVAGVVRLVARRRMLHFPVFGLLTALQFIVLHYPPNSRYLLPLLPLLLAGALVEGQHLAAIIRKTFARPKTGEKVVAAMFAALLAALVIYMGVCIDFGLRRFVPAVLEQSRAALQRNQPAFAWLRANTPRDGLVFSYIDPVVYLYTERRGVSLRIPPRLLYRGDKEEIQRYFNTVPQFVRDFGLRYTLLTASDYQMDAQDLALPALQRVLGDTRSFEPRYADRRVSVWENSSVRLQ